MKEYLETLFARIVAVPVRAIRGIPRVVFWKMWTLAMCIWIVTAAIMRNLIPAVNRFADRAMILQQEIYVLGIWILLFGLIVRRIEEEKFWKLLVLTIIFSAWLAFLFSEGAKGLSH